MKIVLFGYTGVYMQKISTILIDMYGVIMRKARVNFYLIHTIILRKQSMKDLQNDFERSSCLRRQGMDHCPPTLF